MTRVGGERVRHQLWALFEMARPAQLLLVLSVYAFGNVLARALGPSIDVRAAVAGAFPLLFVAASIHYANEYADYETDALTTRTPFSGGSGALQATGLPRRLAMVAAVGSLVVGLVVGVVALPVVSSVAVVLLGTGAVLGWQYSVPPLAFAWNGWGELDNAFLGGVLLPTYGYAVHAHDVPLVVPIACVPFATVVFLNLLATTWPDRTADAAVDKRTLATRWSPSRLRALYAGGAGIALLSPVVLAGTSLPARTAWTSVVLLPVLVWGGCRYTRIRSPLPTVVAMVVALVAHTLVWVSIG